jgi:hypothetical protein
MTVHRLAQLVVLCVAAPRAAAGRRFGQLLLGSRTAQTEVDSQPDRVRDSEQTTSSVAGRWVPIHSRCDPMGPIVHRSGCPRLLASAVAKATLERPFTIEVAAEGPASGVSVDVTIDGSCREHYSTTGPTRLNSRGIQITATLTVEPAAGHEQAALDLALVDDKDGDVLAFLRHREASLRRGARVLLRAFSVHKVFAVDENEVITGTFALEGGNTMRVVFTHRLHDGPPVSSVRYYARK